MVTNAVTYVPPSHPLDGIYAQRCLEHVQERNYHLVAIIREWDQLDQLIRAGSIEVVVFAKREHFFRIWRPRVEFVAQSRDVKGGTDVYRPHPVRHLTGRHRRPRRLS